MRVRQLIERRKTIISETAWSSSDMQPKHSPVYTKTKPMKAGWRWRSARIESDGLNFILTAECNTARDNWKAMLILDNDAGASVVGRLEYHSSHPGLHAHAHCERGGVEMGGSSIDNLARIPPTTGKHRRMSAWTEATFWEAAKRFFRIKPDEGPLFNYAS
ncbi:MAG: hypothetical protein ACLPID_05550 [Beijerinckiaceae bacterium]